MSKESKHIELPTSGIGTSSSSPSSNLKHPVSATFRDEDHVGATVPFSPSFLGPVPTVFEVELAISALRKLIQAVFSQGSESNWLVNMLDGPTSRILMSCGLTTLYKAFQLMEINPSVKGLVVAFATDKALWKAIMKNEMVQKLGESLCTVESGNRLGTIEEPEQAANIMQWIWEMSKAKVMELIEKFQALMNEMFQCGENSKGNNVLKNDDQLEDEVWSSLLLTVVILLIVVIARVNGF